ncbi:ComEC/Rec2 family competence protein [Sulfitobacter pontiacus]|uniref:ComEC/Rec2 family competence protein n=1 Tax=Sulfitobacter pontiacus TaxID=60137 RepID=UPI0021A5451E|nr:MBL fold metallo-hydrolase [Sulfitobacter pontiacus]UWR17528.1 MBL fold metallo-hydrolase [Sulfitobacter pontiacus]
MGYEVEFLSVGDSNGDAITVRYGNAHTGYTINIVDGGYVGTGQVVVDHVRQHYGAGARIDNLVLTHADRDHAGGMETILNELDVAVLWMNRPWLYASEVLDKFHGTFTSEGLKTRLRESYDILENLERVAQSRGTVVREVFAGAVIGDFQVLAPSRERYLELIPAFDRTPKSYIKETSAIVGMFDRAVKAAKSWFETWYDEQLSNNPPNTSAQNEASVVQMGTLDGNRILLTADAGPDALNEAFDNAAKSGILGQLSFVQVPHHGSRRNVTPEVLDKWLGQPLEPEDNSRGVAFVSIGTNKEDYPRHRVKNAFLRRGYSVYRGSLGYIRHASDMPERDGLFALEPLSFTSRYSE